MKAKDKRQKTKVKDERKHDSHPSSLDDERQRGFHRLMLKRAWLFPVHPLLIFAFCLLPFAFTLTACGKRRPPLPPVERVPQRTELLSGVQRGNRVILSWPALRRNASDDSVQSIRRVDVYRLAEGVDDPLPLTEEEFSTRATLIGSVSFDEIQKAKETLSYSDELSLSDPVRLRYAVRYVNAANQRASFSNFLLIEPAASVSQPPAVDPSPEVTQSAIVLRWQAPAANVDGTTPVNLLGYNVYRAEGSQSQPSQTPLNPRPITAASFSDQSFKFGEEYVYVVRAVSLGTGGEPVESLNSNAVNASPRDIFRPSAPTGVTIAASPTPLRISIFFAANPERDIAGYNVYRSEDPDLPKARWTKLNKTLLDRTTFQDDAVQSGKKYFYYVTAVDTSGNMSDPSDVYSETAP
jgi:fibronectin type 3 domain-containing protein